MQSRFVLPIPVLAGALALVGGPSLAAETVSGKMLAEQGTEAVPACSSCHGMDGEGNADIGAPMIAGLDQAYMVHALHAYADGSRPGPTMSGVAPGLQPAEIDAVTAYYAGLTPTAKTWAAEGDGNAGRALVRDGAWARGVPSCTTCHGENLDGVGEVFPRIAGQLPAFVHARLEQWHSGEDEAQTPNEALMAAVAQKLTPDEMSDVAAYLATLPPDAGPATSYKAVETDWPTVTYNTKDRPKEINWASAEASYTKLRAYRKRDDLYEHTPPAFSAIPDGPEGDLIRLGRYLFSNTQVLRGTFVGNGLNCVNCHVGEGRSKTSAPIWATTVDFPQYRGKNKHVNTVPERLAGCFTYSMNGTPPPAQHKVMVALESYMKWLATGIPSDAKLKVRGYQYLPLPEKTADYARGEAVYTERCAVCHGADGQGRTEGARVVFPPLWGEESYNWGAGMHVLDKAAAFIKANMPISNPDLSVQQAWDVALFVNSHERPQDPRWKGDVQTTRNAFHGGHADTYGLKTPNGVMGDTGAPLSKPKPVAWGQWKTQWAPAE